MVVGDEGLEVLASGEARDEDPGGEARGGSPEGGPFEAAETEGTVVASAIWR